MNSEREVNDGPVSLSRREFFKTAAAAGVVLAGTLPVPAVSAAEPVKRNGKPHMKLSLAAYSFRDVLGGDKPVHDAR